MIQVQVPATAANLGAGFDSMALALELFNTVDVEQLEHGVELEIEGEGAGHLPRDASNLIARAALRTLRELERENMGLRMRARNDIPVGSGLGSSAAAALTGALAANALVDGGLSDASLLSIVADIEGHADNAAAALHGSLTLVAPHRTSDNRFQTATLLLPPTTVVVVVPKLGRSTNEMRRALPRNVPLADATYGIGHAALTIEALRRGDYGMLANAVDDRLHEPYRMRLIPGAHNARQAALEAGAAAVALCGAGPAVIAFAESGHADILKAMTTAFHEGARGFQLDVSGGGARLTR